MLIMVAEEYVWVVMELRGRQMAWHIITKGDSEKERDVLIRILVPHSYVAEQVCGISGKLCGVHECILKSHMTVI